MLLVLIAQLFLAYPVYPQNRSENDTILRVSPGTFIMIRDSVSFFLNDTLLKLPSTLIPVNNQKIYKEMLFLDSLKMRASKYMLTKKLYDFVIVSPDTIDKKRIIGTSDAGYINHTGRKIRKIEIQRLNVFGVNISNPASANPNKIENILNKTHFNTNENIIRKNLLFSEGDIVSPLTLSDNERILRQLP